MTQDSIEDLTQRIEDKQQLITKLQRQQSELRNELWILEDERDAQTPIKVFDVIITATFYGDEHEYGHVPDLTRETTKEYAQSTIEGNWGQGFPDWLIQPTLNWETATIVERTITQEDE